MLMNCNEFSFQADTNCPLHPATNDLPCPLPQGVTDTLKQVEKHLSTVLNSTNVVSWLVSRMYFSLIVYNVIMIILLDSNDSYTKGYCKTWTLDCGLDYGLEW